MSRTNTSARSPRWLLMIGALALAAASAHAQVPVQIGERAGAAVSGEGSGVMSGVVNINTAGEEELERLPAIGPARARAIIALRARLTRFTRIDELLRVKGIGRATFRKLRPHLALEGPTTFISARASR